MPSPEMTYVTLIIWLRSLSSNLVFVLPWCFWVQNLVRIHQLLPQVLSGNHLSHALNDLCDLQNKVKVTQFERGLRHVLELLCTKFGEDTLNTKNVLCAHSVAST